jgi:hypothetical protein
MWPRVQAFRGEAGVNQALVLQQLTRKPGVLYVVMSEIGTNKIQDADGSRNLRSLHALTHSQC